MRRKSSTGSSIVMIWLFGLMTAPALPAAGPKPYTATWDNLTTVTPSTKMHIVLKDKKSYLGKYQTANDNTIVIRLETGDQTFSRQDVLRVSTKGESHRLRNTLIGASVRSGSIVEGSAPSSVATCSHRCCSSVGSI